ncbi:PDZ domain-containing protein [Streptomyces albus subsp. chlorinus]|uniref:YlbL family protein n=1 Tax=Streptomyces albus TaxID=1888 RepID=UPI00156FEBC5|nr:PDZ domain-containing protein [Streptomyces albus]NSC23776.1 PDZ domain-containing protein [Streptomyces albus subsp. chlorinus]
MPRRTATLLASTLLLIAMLCAGVLIEVPYAEMSPGPTVNTLGVHDGDPVLRIKDEPGHKGRPKEYDTSGHLNMTTVRVTGSEYRMTLLGALSGWLRHDSLVVPYKTVYPEQKSAEEVDQENAEEFSASQESAKVAALKELHIPTSSHVVVGSVAKDAPAHERLHAGDVITAVDGRPVGKAESVGKIVTRHKPGEKVTFTVIPKAKVRAAQEKGKKPSPRDARKVTVGTTKAKEDGRTVVGITTALGHSFPFEIDIKLADIGGPSAGLMFALGIVDKLTPTDLTGGKFVAGTGTIDDNGKVGEIGGIQMKIIGAREKGARYFLTPAGNCATAAKDKPKGITLVKTSTMDDALSSLKKIRSGRTDRLTRCRAG